MKSNLYKIQLKEKDSISDVATDLGIDVKVLIDFHNSNSQPHEWIRKDLTIAPWVKELIIPDTAENLRKIKNLRESKDVVQLVQTEVKARYKIVQKIDMQISGSSMIDSETEIIWNHSKTKKENVFYSDIKQESHQIKYIKSIYRQFAEYMQKLNKPLEHLILELFDEGKVKALSNQNEVKEIWSSLKKELKPEMGNTPEEKNMIEGGDKDFSNTLPLINNNVLYKLFFNDLFYQYSELDIFVDLEQQEYISQIFAAEKVMLSKKRKVKKEGDLVRIKLYYESDPKKNGRLKEIYNTKLKDFLQEDYSYSLTWSIEYLFEIRQGKMLSCHSKIKEQASSKYCHLTEHTIELI
ncbi:hypothetical protein [Chryseobacterium geocarposphaerae]|uniref:LysM domain-containing protein n=1 Tax=Chryseobacterium geocarposphaerae TaxID=1416776 RepID=A0A2M9BXZ2_9FLAO|nr:hypothetical protein [Chryseobacterium geocarposphaerae]PJJ62949.1 hypothetical protein CLV73_3466 [Chryseobacterium geocarposphaerae]